MQDRQEHLHEQLLITRAQAGDAAAFHGLVRQYAARLRYYLRRMVGGTAEDVLQEVWLAVHRELPRLRAPASFRCWLYRIARSQASRHLRSRRAVQQIPDDDELPDTASDHEWTADDAEDIHHALEVLKDAHREVLVLRFIEAMSYDEIARVLGVPPGTVRSRIHYAKLALRKIVEGESHE